MRAQFPPHEPYRAWKHIDKGQFGLRLIELLPWLKQWHNEPDAAFDGMRMGDNFEGFVQEEARQLNKTTPKSKPGRHRPAPAPVADAEQPLRGTADVYRQTESDQRADLREKRTSLAAS